MNVKRMVIAMGVAAAAFGARAEGDIVPTYALGNPPVTPIRDTTDASQNDWLRDNAFHVAMSSCATNDAHSVTNADSTGSAAYTLVGAQVGFPWERLKPEYYLSDRIAAPDDVDWRATYEKFQEDYKDDTGDVSGFLFNFTEDDPCIYAANGGTHVINWMLKDGTTNTETYVIGSVCQGRPKRIYWTDPPYNSPKISLTGKFVRFFGSEALVSPHTGTVTQFVGGVEMVQENMVTEGLYLDKDSMVLEARGKLTGQVLMVYYDSGNYDSILCVQVLEVCQPDVIVNGAAIGSALKPDGRGYEVEGLEARVTAGVGDTTDDRGDYLYQHAGQHSYSPKNKQVFALRPTFGERWKAEIYWMETDPMEVQWPFEVDQYELTWPADIQRYVRGDLAGDPGAPIRIPNDYTAELQKYQEPDGHAKDVDGNGEFLTDLTPFKDEDGKPVTKGRSLLKLSGEDNVWFMPVESILRSDASVYTLKPERINVGDELTVRGGSYSGVAAGLARPFAATMDVPGYVYEAGTPAGNYDANLYSETNAASAIYAVSANGSIEVWWSERWKPGDLPVAITAPVLPQVYTPVWPETDEAPQIVIASQKGSANETVFAHHGAACLDAGTNATLHLPDRIYFPGGEGALMFWTRANHYNDRPKTVPASGRLFTLGRSGDSAFLTAEIASGRLYVNGWAVHDFGKPERENAWTHLAFVISNGTATVFVDGARKKTVDNLPAVDWTKPLAGNTFGSRTPGDAVPKGREFAEITMVRRPLSAEEIGEGRYKVRSGDEAELTGYFSFREGEDLVAASQTSGGFERRFLDRAGGGAGCAAVNVLYMRPGAPMKGSAVILADATPTLYVQNDPKAKGYNPNDEHAVISTGGGGYVAYALRCDLATKDTPPPAVLVEYRADGKNRLQFYHVLLTNADWPELADKCNAGMVLPGPRPLTDFPDPWLKETRWDDPPNGRPGIGYRDRKGQIWARAAGELVMRMYYAMQEGFCFPSLAQQPAPGTPVPWLARVGNARADVLTGNPAAWTWRVKWPAVNTMKIGQTLTTAADGLPEVWNARSMAVVYPDPGEADEVVMLSDPTVIQSVPFPPKVKDMEDKDVYGLLTDFGLSIDPNGGLTLKGGKYHFTDLPPSLSSRLYVDATNKRLCFLGERVEKNAGATILYPNVLSSSEQAAVAGLARANTDNWAKIVVAGLATAPVIANTTRNPERSGEFTTAYTPVDHYALTAMGATNYVVLIENDATSETMEGYDAETNRVSCAVQAGDPIQMHVFLVTNLYYTGRIVTREDEVNLLSQQLSVLYTDPIGGKADGFEFEWKHAEPNMDGTIPDDYPGGYVARPVSTACGEVAGSTDTAGVGLTRFVVGQQGDTLANMVNTYWICRYRAVEGTPARATMGEEWSAWCAPPALAEGWVQRVLNNVTPFNQRMTDLYANKAETAVSMIQQAGAPFTGDVALNQDNLTSVGLIQLYETILDKAETLSIANYGGAATVGVAKQLQLAVERLADLYKVLGDEAYSDAKNPTISFGETQDGWDKIVSGSEASSLFCFDNQVNSLLDEELCLLRGRSGVSAPTCRTGPYYNRLLWNFTKGITAGEVAYAVNYDVGGTETVALSEEQAARLYPQGHGDAYGHYLSALKGWYRLLRNPNFAWFRPSQTEMNVADSAVNVDYYEEAKFAEAAADLAKTAADVVDLSARKAWRDDGKNGSGYLDTDANNAFGYGEWASRGGYGALVNWATANSILPEDCTLQTSQTSQTPYTDKGLTRIDRGTVDELEDICESAAAIMRAVDRIDSGLNPLGLSENAIPFDIAPGGVADGTATHFEQVRDRAKTALANARKVLERAQTQGSRMRLIQEAADDYEDAIDIEETDYNGQLIGYFGTPYSDDIGPGKTYEQGYSGPDLIHYMWMDLDQYALDGVDNITFEELQFGGTRIAEQTEYDAIRRTVNDMLLKSGKTLTFDVTRSGFIKKPSNITGYRTVVGSIQEKYAALLLAYYDFDQSAVPGYNKAKAKYDVVKDYTSACLGLQTAFKVADEAYMGTKAAFNVSSYTLNYLLRRFGDNDKTINMTLKQLTDASPSVVGAGMTVVTSPQSIVKAVANSTYLYKYIENTLVKSKIQDALAVQKFFLEELENALKMAESAFSYYKDYYSLTEQFKEAALALNSAYWAEVEAMQKIEVAVDALRAEIGKAEAVLSKREASRRRQVNKLSQYRYNEMLFRRIRDRSLTRYSAAFDLAQKYVYMAAQVYDYETALKREETGAGDDFKAKIVTTRSLGAFDSDGEPMVGDKGDLGLAGYLAQMDANWDVLKPRLGINNPQNYATWFSLRKELFRILEGEEGDAAWKKELNKHWTEDILSNGEFKRYCQPFQSKYGLREKEPGLVIPFETTIDFAKNLFGHDLAGGDHAYDSTWYSTRIAAAGVWFDGYNQKAEGAASSAQAQLGADPVVYLVPVGFDCLRAPGLADGTYWQFSVVDQVIPAPYNIGSYELDRDSWMPSLNDADWQGVDAAAKIRRHPSFRAYFDPAGGEPTDDRLDATRLVGRSVWNTRWLLVIPAGSMNADREKALSVFINGSDTNRDGKLDLKPVSDIRIGFRTYSQSGN